MNEGENLENTQMNEEQGQENKTFTQDEVNEIIKKRLARERQKGTESVEDSFAEREKDLQNRENLMYARERFFEENLPADLINLASGKSKEEIDEVIKTLKPYVDKKKEPAVNVSSGKSWAQRQSSGRTNDTDQIRKAMGLNR